MHSERAESGESGPGVAISGLPLLARRLEGDLPSGGARLTHLAEIVRCEPTQLGFCDASGLGAGGVWVYPAGNGNNLVWRHPWPEDVTS